MAFVDATGLQIKTIEEILAELSTQQRAEIDATLNTAPDEPLGQLNGIFAAQLREVWEVAQVAYNGLNPDAAEGFLLEKLSALTGTRRAAATKSRVPVLVNLDIGTTLIAGTHFANVVGEPDNRWTPEADFTAPSTGGHALTFEAEFTGPMIANLSTISVISTPLSGWNLVSNAFDSATPGTDIDSDPELRQRREEELRATGSATLDAIRADVLADVDVLQCSVFENVSNVTDINGLPPKSFEVVVYDGEPPQLTNDQIAQLIFDTKGAGIKAFGSESGTAVDSLGFSHTIGFTRPAEVLVWLEVDIDVNSSSGYAGATAVKEQLVLLNVTDLLQGRDVILQRISKEVMTFAGVIDVTGIRIGLTVAPVGTTNLVINNRQIARLDAIRIAIAENFITIP